MKRRQFLRNGLVLGAAGILPNDGLASSLLGNLPQDAPPLQSNDADQTNSSFDADFILVSEQRIGMALKFDANTMIAPVVLAKENCQLSRRLLDAAAAKNIYYAAVDERCVNIGLIKAVSNPSGVRDAWLAEQGYEVEMWGHTYYSEPVVQDIFDDLDAGDVVPEKHYEFIADTLSHVHHLKEQRVDRNRPPLCHAYNFRLEGNVVLASGRGANVALRYNDKTMIAPIIFGKGDAIRFRNEWDWWLKVNYEVASVMVPGNSPFDTLLRSEELVMCFHIDERDEPVVQDIFDNLDVGEVIPERHYECIADILERHHQDQNRRIKEAGCLTQEEIEALLDNMVQELNTEQRNNV